MFRERLPSRDASAVAHLARMIALLGPPPKEIMERGKFSQAFFDKDGTRLETKYMLLFRYLRLVDNFTPDFKLPHTSLEAE